MTYKSLILSTLKDCSYVVTLIVFVLSAANPLYAADGTWGCTLGTEEWKDANGGASLNADRLTFYSGDDRIEGIYIMMSKPAAVGSFTLNDGAQASFSDTAGGRHNSKSGSGTLVITKYDAPKGTALGKVEGTFSGDFEAGTSKEYKLKGCTFSLPVKNL